MDFLVEVDLPDGTTERLIYSADIPEGSVIESAVVSVNNCVNGWPVGESFPVPTRILDTRESAENR